MRFIFNLCDRVALPGPRRGAGRGDPGEVQSDPRVIEAYIGSPRRPDAPRADEPGPNPGRQSMLEVKDLDGRLRPDQGASRASASPSSEGEVVTLHRHQRGRQDHHPAHHLRPAEARLGRDLRSTASDLDETAGARDRRARARALPGGSPDLPAHDGARRTSSSARSPARTPRRSQTDLERRLRPVPGPGRAARPAGRHLLRWRAADAGHRPGHDEPAQAAHARRAVDGAVARS